MKKFFSLLKATTKGELNIFKFKGKGKGKLILIVYLSLMVMASSFFYASMFMEPLYKMHLSYIVLTLFSLGIVIINIMEGIYKSQGIIFDAKDNNLLFSMPIKTSNILTTRILKLLAFDYIFEFLFMIPCIIRYVTLEQVTISFYLITFIFLILLPLMPLVISAILGYLIKALSSLFKNKKMMQTVISLISFFLIYALIFNLQGILDNFVSKAKSINELISRIYLPIGLYIGLIQNFDIIKLLELLFISVVPFILFIIIFQHNYSKIINVSKESSTKKKINKKTKIEKKSPINALTQKEVMTYFSIPAYVVNTIIGPIIALIAGVGLFFKYDAIMATLTSKEFNLTASQISNYAPLFVIAIIIVLTAMTTITSSSISLEGKKMSLLKSLPIKPYDLFLSKILTSDLVIIPFMLLSSILMIIKLEIYNYNIIFIVLAAIIFPHLTGEIGLLVNLKYPKFDYASDAEVIKQSFAVIVAMLINLLICILTFVTFTKVSTSIGVVQTMTLYSIVLIVLTIFINYILKTYGTKKYNEL